MIVADEPGFYFGSRDYRDFFARHGLTPFQHPDWLEPFYRWLPAADGSRPLILVGRDKGTGQLRLVLPLLAGEAGGVRSVRSAFLGVTDYACPVIDPASCRHVSIRNHLQRLLGEHVFEAGPIHSDHREIWAELAGCDPVPLNFGAHAVYCGAAGSPTQEMGRFRPIGSLRRKQRRLSRLGELRIERVEGAEASLAIKTARDFRAGRFQGDLLQIERYAAFYADVASRTGGLARTLRLACGGRTIAVMFGLMHRTRFHYILLGCDYASHADHSPGLLILDLAIRSWAEEGGDVFDFTIGDEAFKTRFGCSRSQMFQVEYRLRGI